VEGEVIESMTRNKMENDSRVRNKNDKMASPSWMDTISNEVVCGYFYIFFLIFSVWAGLSILGGIFIFTTSKMTLPHLISIILSCGISTTSALFLYLICERALKPVRDPFQDAEDPMM